MAHMREAVKSGHWPLYRYHPEAERPFHLDSKPPTTPLREFAVTEARFAMLARTAPEEFARLQALNRRYNARFGFPFILAVRNLDRQRILEEFAWRVEREPETEFAECLAQVAQIARLRLDALLESRPVNA